MEVARPLSILRRLRNEISVPDGERRFMELVDAIPYAILVSWVGKIVYVNDTAVRTLKARSAEDLLGLAAADLWHPDDLDRMRARRDYLLASGEPLPLEDQRRICRDGSVVWVEASGVRTEWLGQTATLNVFRDITERREGEEQRRRQEEDYRRLVQLSPDPVLVAAGGTIVFANAAASDTFGATPDRPLTGAAMGEILIASGGAFEVGEQEDAVAPEPGPYVPLDLKRLDGTPMIGDVSRTRLTWNGEAAIQLVVHNVSDKWHLAQLMKNPVDMPLDDQQLLELILWRSVRGGSAMVLAERLIQHFGSFAGVVGAESGELATVEGLEPTVILKLKSIEDAVIRLTREDVLHHPVINNMGKLERYLRAAMSRKRHEETRLLLLDVKQRIVLDEVLHRGTVNHAPLYPREVVKRALTHSASAIILAHNHPSGDPTPSGVDIETTLRIKQAAEILGIRFHDHLIVTKAGISSFRDMGLLD